ncbi:MAG: divalent cation tolerance protein CutA [Candidatus Aenigmatarchaeota archaeon]
MSRMKIVLTYVDSEKNAENIAESLLKERLAACVGFWSGRSRYWWKGKIEKNNNEIHMIVKTKESLVKECVKRIKELHNYELPVIDVLDIEKLNPEAEKWINEVTK